MTNGPRDAAAWLAREGVRRVAHRGHSAALPENTLQSFRAALDLGVDGVELDYRLTADGVPVVVHDETLDRTTDAAARWGASSIPVVARRCVELRTLDAGGWFDPRCAGAQIPTLTDALAVVAERALPIIERKAGEAEALVRLLEEGDFLRRVVVVSFDWAFLERCRALAGDLVLGAIGQGEVEPGSLARCAEFGAAVLAWKQQDLDAATVAAVHAGGFKAWAWTVNDEARARALVAAGIDGLVSDDPPALDFLSR